jgi:flagellar basal-body rod modification protein FlgD
MSVTSISTAAVADSTASESQSSLGLTTDSFMQLLVAQIQNQDPLEPMDSTEYIAQLATLTEVEQSVETNSQLESIRSQIAYGSALSENALIGRAVTAPSEEILLSGGSSQFSYAIDGTASAVSAYIKDSNGDTVREIDNLDATSSTLHTVSWDGKNDSGETVEDGTYTVSLSATDATGSYTTYARDTITGVEYYGDQQYLKLSTGALVNSGDVVRTE